MNLSNSHSQSYADAGVDVTAGYEAVRRIKPLAESTFIPGVMGSLGGFGGLFAPDLTGMEKPVLVSGADGVGTKLKLAFLLDKHDTVGMDCVAMCVNDIVCSGAKPLFFLDYLAVGKNDPARVADIVSGVAEGCRRAGCALIGGETAEMPGFYPENEYDLAGFAVGMADESRMLTGAGMTEGDLLIGLASSGVHSNGFSLIRKVLPTETDALREFVPELGCTLGEELLRPTRIYVKTILCLLARGIPLRAVSHITGGGLYENLPRVLPPHLTARVSRAAFPIPPIFTLIQKAGDIPLRDMFNTFNMGVGMVLVIPKEAAGAAMELLVQAGERAYVIGQLAAGDGSVTFC